MTWTLTLAVACFTGAVGWSAYEAFRMRRHRSKTDLMLSLTTVILQKLESRQNVAIEAHQSIAKTLSELTRHKNPTE